MDLQKAAERFARLTLEEQAEALQGLGVGAAPRQRRPKPDTPRTPLASLAENAAEVAQSRRRKPPVIRAVRRTN
jgi:hypothetical protein